jgi:hypothetical protein
MHTGDLQGPELREEQSRQPPSKVTEGELSLESIKLPGERLSSRSPGPSSISRGWLLLMQANLNTTDGELSDVRTDGSNRDVENLMKTEYEARSNGRQRDFTDLYIQSPSRRRRSQSVHVGVSEKAGFY